MKILLFALILLVVMAPPGQGQAGPLRSPDRKVPNRAVPVETDHLVLMTYVTSEVVKSGAQFFLVFEIIPRPRMHVYAPGAHRYQTIRVRLDPHPRLIVRPLEYPPSETFVFEPLDERVPVYQKAFILRQPLLVRAPARGTRTGIDEVSIKGTLEYQACDDRVCFKPQSIPISYTVRVK